jgi:hypothetical protein
MIAVCDMGPLHYLVLIGCDHILPRIFDRVITAPEWRWSLIRLAPSISPR